MLGVEAPLPAPAGMETEISSLLQDAFSGPPKGITRAFGMVFAAMEVRPHRENTHKHARNGGH